VPPKETYPAVSFNAKPVFPRVAGETGKCFLLGFLLLDPEDESNMFLLNVGSLLPDYTVFISRRKNS
jgi:hypothetical protein